MRRSEEPYGKDDHPPRRATALGSPIPIPAFNSRVSAITPSSPTVSVMP